MEEVVYDTSALVELLRGGKRTVEGFTTVLNVIEFPKALGLKEMGVIYPVVEDYAEATKMSAQLLKIGKPIPAIDVMVAAIALRRNLTLYTGDAHFEYVKQVRKELKLKILK